MAADAAVVHLAHAAAKSEIVKDNIVLDYMEEDLCTNQEKCI